MIENKYNIKKIEFGEKILGPILYEFCNRLRIYLKAYDKRQTIILYEARGGLRIKYLYNLFLKKNNYISEFEEKEFYISRLAAVNGCLKRDFDYVSKVLVKEFNNNTLGDLTKAILKKRELNIPENIINKNVTLSSFKEIYSSNEQYGEILRKHFEEQDKLFSEYLEKLIGEKNKVLLVDTGWTGNTQAILMKAFKDKDWVGLYFGRWDYADVIPWHFYNVNGISIDDNSCKKNNIRSAVFYYHHLIEDPLEPKMSSVEYYVKKNSEIIPQTEKRDNLVRPQKEKDYFFEGIVNYFNKTAKLSNIDIHKKANVAYKILSKKITFPNKTDSIVMAVEPRSADFGRDFCCEPIIRDNIICSLYKKKQNISKAVWRQGQIRYEFPIIAPLILLLYYIYSRRKGKIVL
jgi:hypothetical protein